jgi:hypothetical protein
MELGLVDSTVKVSITYSHGITDVDLTLTSAKFAEQNWQTTYLTSNVDTINITSAGNLFINDNASIINLVADGDISLDLKANTNVDVLDFTIISNNGDVAITSGNINNFGVLTINAPNGTVGINANDNAGGSGGNSQGGIVGDIPGGSIIVTGPDPGGAIIITGPNTVFCTADVFECPDGSYVSRDPENNCAFPPCP